MYYRYSGENFITDKKIKGVWLFLSSALLQPGYAVHRVKRQFFKP
jgi:hypothetical protein